MNSETSRKSVHTPMLKSFVIADSVFQQSVTNKWCIIGIFQRIQATKFPVLHQSLGLYVSVGDAQGEYDVRVDFRNAEDKRLASFSGLHLQVKDRLAEVNFGIQTRDLIIPSPGKYHFFLHFNTDQIGQIPLEAVVIKPGGLK